jgi:hypothetical protein
MNRLSPTDCLYLKMVKSYGSYEILYPTTDPDGISFFIFGSHVMHIWSTEPRARSRTVVEPLLFSRQPRSLDAARGSCCDLLDDHGAALLKQQPSSAEAFTESSRGGAKQRSSSSDLVLPPLSPVDTMPQWVEGA